MCLGYFHIPSESHLYHSITIYNTSSLCNPLDGSVTYRYSIIILISPDLAVAYILYIHGFTSNFTSIHDWDEEQGKEPLITEYILPIII